MTRHLFRLVGAVALLTGLLGGTAGAADAATEPTRSGWTAGWQAPVASSVDLALPAGPYTLRDNVRVTAAGTALRLRLSNRFGDRAATFGPVTVALPTQPGTPVPQPDTARTLRFGGSERVTVEVGQDTLSDPVAFPVEYATELLVSVLLPEPPGRATLHPAAIQSTWLATGDHVADGSAEAFAKKTAHYYLTGIQVETGPHPGLVVAFGDSITDGVGARSGSNQRWPDLLADRLRTQPAESRFAVGNAGISGNKVLDYNEPLTTAGEAALRRFDRDALEQPGIRTVVLLEGINDIRRREPPTAEQLTDGYRQLVERARAAGVRVLGATLLPMGGNPGYTAEKEAIREQVNTWIRTSGAFDAVLDLDAATRDPADPHRMRAEYHAGDWLHPSGAGYRAMADAVDLALL